MVPHLYVMMVVMMLWATSNGQTGLNSDGSGHFPAQRTGPKLIYLKGNRQI
jgi:hypothetical protein